MNLSYATRPVVLCIIPLVAQLVAVACSSESQPMGATAGAPVPTGTVSSSSGSGGATTTTPSGSAGSTGSAAAGTKASTAGSPSAAGATAGATSMAAGAGGAVAAAGSSGTGSMPTTNVACDPKDMMPAPTAVSYKVLVGGYETLDKPPTTGPLTPVIEVHPGFPDWTVYRPEPLDADTKHPIVVFGNGGCLLNGTLFGQWTLEIASYGVVSVVDGKPQSKPTDDPIFNGIRSGPDGKPLVMAMDWITAENERPCSMFYHKLDLEKIAVAGQSCGGMMTLLSAGDKRVSTALVLSSGLSGDNQMLFSTYHAPMLFITGGTSDMLHATALANFNAINDLPLWFGSQNSGHMGTWDQINAGEMGRAATGWVRWQLLGEPGAEKMFKGADCELCKPPSEWVMIQKKMID